MAKILAWSLYFCSVVVVAALLAQIVQLIQHMPAEAAAAVLQS
jgi:hypothetical protein